MVKRYYKQSSFTCPRKSQERSEKSILPPCPVFFPANLDLFDKIIYNSKVQFHMRVLFNGRTLASQAKYVGSIPIIRSKPAPFAELFL